MKKVLIVFELLSVSNFPQSRLEHNSIIVPQGFGIKLLNSFGTSSIYNDVSVEFRKLTIANYLSA